MVFMADMAEDAIQRPVSTATPKWASDGNEPESSEATTVGAQSGDGSEPESSEATTVAAQSGDGNEPQSSDTITRGATAVSNEIKSSPSQSSMAVHNHTSIDDGLPEPRMRFKVHMCCKLCEEVVNKEVFDVPGVVGIRADLRRSEVAVFGKVYPQEVLKKLKRVDKKSIYLGIQSLDLIEAVRSHDAAKASEALAQQVWM